jgi:tight adherence protein C
MSDLFLPMALIGIFVGVSGAAVAIQGSMAARRRSLDMLRSQVQEVDLRGKALAEPFYDRVLLPFVGGLGSAARRITPVGMRDRIARKLILAGSPQGMDAEKVAAFKVFGSAAGAVVALALTQVAGATSSMTLVAMIAGGLFGYLVPGAGLGQRAIGRQEAIRLALPDTMDLLTISVEAGLGFDAALAHVRRNVPGPLSDEIGRMLQEMQLGISRVDAFRHFAARTDVDELKAFVLAMIQADSFGISIAKVLRAQSKELRMKRRQRAEEKAIKVPVKLLFPMIFCILPSMFVVLVGPGVIRIMQAFLGTQF